MRSDRQEQVEVAGGSAAHAGLAFAGETDPGTVLDARRNVHRQRLLLALAAGAATAAARVLAHLADAAAGRPGPPDREEALLCAPLSGTVSGLAGARLRPLLCPRPGPSRAG